jgi:superoxide dismutase, Cu-Zn family
MMNARWWLVFAGVSGACSHSAEPARVAPEMAHAEEREAEAELATVEGLELKGQAKLKEVKDGVRITLKVKDAVPGQRGVHIHEIGDCSDIAGKSMGSHFAPDAAEHGLPSEPEHHFGDLGNISIQESGKGELDIIVPRANLRPDDRHSLLGRAVVIHEQKDTGEGESGQSGAPMACAVIEGD